MGKLLKFLAGERTNRAVLIGAVMLVAEGHKNGGGETGQNATELAQVEDDEGRIGTEAAGGERKRGTCFDVQILKCFTGTRRLEQPEY